MMTTQNESKPVTSPVTEQRFYLYVSGWTYGRKAMIQNGKLRMEIALGGCSHCATCSRRINFISSRFANMNIPYSFIHIGGSLFVEIDFNEDVSNVGTYMTKLLGVSVTPG